MNRKILILVGILIAIPICLFYYLMFNEISQFYEQTNSNKSISAQNGYIQYIQYSQSQQQNGTDKQNSSAEEFREALKRESQIRSSPDYWYGSEEKIRNEAASWGKGQIGKSRYDKNITYADMISYRSIEEFRAARRNEEIKTIAINVGIGIVVAFFIFQLIRTAKVNNKNNSKTIKE